MREIIAVSRRFLSRGFFRSCRTKDSKFVLAVDEYGGTAGIVTFSDVMERIFGSLDDEYIQNEESEVVF